MGNSISVVIVDDVVDVRENVKKLLNFEDDIEVIGEASNGEEAVAVAEKLAPDIILMDINMPVVDGITATEAISIKAPACAVVMMSVQEEQEYLRKAMMAGARDFLVKPFSNADLVNTIRNVHEKQRQTLKFSDVPAQKAAENKTGKLMTIFSTKGGTGKTTIAVNMGAAIARMTGKKVCIVDLDLQFGDVAILMNLKMVSTISDLVENCGSTLDPGDILAYVHKHKETGASAYLSCTKPHLADLVSVEHVKQILMVLRENFDYVILDTSAAFRDIELTALDMSELILIIVTLELSALKSIKLAYEVLQDILQYKDDKVKLILNKDTDLAGISGDDVKASLKKEYLVRIPEDLDLVTAALNKGVPFYSSKEGAPKVILAIEELAMAVMTAEDRKIALENVRKDDSAGFMGRLKGMFKG